MKLNKKGPMSGVRVIDLTAIVSGPVATMMLADQGADVIKVEPIGGEQLRQLGTPQPVGMTGIFLSCNRSKRSISLNLKSPKGLEIVKKLIESADVFVQNFRPGAAKRLGLGEEQVRKLKKDIIYVSISGFGEKGPYSQQRVYDPVIQALSGLTDVQADQDKGIPRMVRTIIPDKTTSVTVAQAITAALFHREKNQEGQHVKIAMLDTMIAYLWPEAMSVLSFVGNEGDPRDGSLGLDLVFKTKDRYITAGAISDSEWHGMCSALNREDLIEDSRFISAKNRTVNRQERLQIMSNEIKKWNSKELLLRFRGRGVPSAPVLNRSEVLEDPQVIENEIMQIYDDDKLGKIRQPRPAAIFDKTPSQIRSMAPQLGEHTGDILKELGYSIEKIRSLLNENIINLKQSKNEGAI
mgnify:CR=1 FL=1